MQRFRSQPRRDWRQTVESQGLLFHSPEGETYWDESAYYRFTRAEIDVLEKATQEKMSGLTAGLNIPGLPF